MKSLKHQDVTLVSHTSLTFLQAADVIFNI